METPVVGLSRVAFSNKSTTKSDMNAAFRSLDFVFMKKMDLYCYIILYLYYIFIYIIFYIVSLFSSQEAFESRMCIFYTIQPRVNECLPSGYQCRNQTYRLAEHFQNSLLQGFLPLSKSQTFLCNFFKTEMLQNEEVIIIS